MRARPGLVLLVCLTAVACKKKEDEPTPAASAHAAPAPAASVAPRVAAAEAPSASAPGEPAAAAGPAPATAPAVGEADKAAAGGEKRPVAPAQNVAGFQSFSQCCAALAAGAKKRDMNSNRYAGAASVCQGLAAQVKAGKANAAAARTTLRAQLQGVPVPGGC